MGSATFQMTSRGWLITVNNPTGAVSDWITHRSSVLNGISYAAWQLERVSTPHIQAFLWMSRPVRLTAIKKFLPTAHIESIKGTPEQARDYVTKEDTRELGPFMIGSFPLGQGHRSDIDMLITSIEDGAHDRTLYRTMPKMLLKFPRGVDRLYSARDQPRFRPFLDVIVHWGLTGTGKTWDIWMEHADDDMFDIIPVTGRAWFDGYNQQSVVLFDDYRPNWFTPSVLLRVLDRYPLRLEKKGLSVAWNPKKIYITTDTHPGRWFEDRLFTDQLLRRITMIKHYV